MPNYVTITEAAAYFPGRPHANSIRRWMSDGYGGVRLRSVRIAGRRLTTTQWVDEFVEKLQAASHDSLAHHQAEAALDRLGV